MPPEIEKEATQEEMGWEDLTSTGDGRSEGFDEPEPEPKPDAEEGGEQPAEATEESTQEPPVEGEPTEPVVEGEAAKGEQKKQTWTLDGGQTVTAEDLAKNPDLISRIVTQSNQAVNYQRLAEQRAQQAAEADAERRRLLDQYTEWQIQQQQAAQQAQAPAPPQRPANTALAGHYEPHLQKLVEDGRLTEDQKVEFGNVISEYLFDQQAVRNMINEVVMAGSRRIEYLENQLFGDVYPDVERRRQMDALSLDQQVQQAVATQEGYESLADQGEWNRLKLFIAQKVNASPRDEQGRPTFDPQFDAETMAQMYDAMTGGDIRAKLRAQKAAQEEAAKAAAAQAGGETSARAGRPAPRQPSKMTPEEEAMDFGDPRMASG
mgnify:CR=1 FL=1